MANFGSYINSLSVHIFDLIQSPSPTHAHSVTLSELFTTEKRPKCPQRRGIKSFFFLKPGFKSMSMDWSWLVPSFTPVFWQFGSKAKLLFVSKAPQRVAVSACARCASSWQTAKIWRATTSIPMGPSSACDIAKELELSVWCIVPLSPWPCRCFELLLTWHWDLQLCIIPLGHFWLLHWWICCWQWPLQRPHGLRWKNDATASLRLGKNAPWQICRDRHH